MAQPAALTSRSLAPHGGYLLAGFGSILFAMKGILIKLAYGTGNAIAVDAITLLALRMSFAMPVYVVIGALTWRDRIKDGVPLPAGRLVLLACLVGLLGYYLSSYLDFQGLVYLSAQFERLILYTYPVFVMILGALFFGGRLTRLGILALVVSYAGIATIFLDGGAGQGPHVALGVALVLGSAFTFALYQLLAKSLITQVGSRMFTCVAMTAASIGMLTHFFAWKGVSALFALPAHIVLIGAVLAIFATVLPSFMLNAALGRIGAEAVAMIGTLSPVATIAMAIMVLGEPFTLTDAFGTLLVIAGVGLFTWHDGRRRAAPPEMSHTKVPKAL
jgi:drug/metabolite transporter (DMT)-like permease